MITLSQVFLSLIKRPKFKSKEDCSELSVVNNIAEQKQFLKLLKHPLVEAFLSVKREKFKLFFGGWAVIKFFYFSLFTSLTISEYVSIYNETISKNGSDSAEGIGVADIEQDCNTNIGLRVGLGSSCLFLVAVEVLQIYVYKKDYFWQLLNWIQIFILLSTYFLVFSSSSEWCQYRKGIAVVTFPLLSFETL